MTRILLLAVLVLSVSGCYSSQTIDVRSSPSGAAILIDGVDCGERTPATLSLPVDDSYVITLAKAGYNEVAREVVYEKDIKGKTPKEIGGAILCAPCCCGLPLLTLLEPVRIKSRFVPNRLDVQLDPEGQGVKISTTPSNASVYVDGVLASRAISSFVLMPVGTHEVEVTAPGFRSVLTRVQVREGIYDPLDIVLDIDGQGFLLSGVPDGAGVFIDDRFVGPLGAESQRYRTEPGDRELRVELDGYRTWSNTVNVKADQFFDLNIELQPAGQGLIIVKPQGAHGQPTILANDEVVETGFDRPIRLPVGTYRIEVTLGKKRWIRNAVRVFEDSFVRLTPEFRH